MSENDSLGVMDQLTVAVSNDDLFNDDTVGTAKKVVVGIPDVDTVVVTKSDAVVVSDGIVVSDGNTVGIPKGDAVG